MFELDLNENEVMIADKTSVMLWHRRLGHLGNRNTHLSKKMVSSLDYSNDDIHSCVSCAGEPKRERQKWDAKSAEYEFVGYCEDSTNNICYRLMDRNQQIIRARNVIFFEDEIEKNSDDYIEDYSVPVFQILDLEINKKLPKQ